MLIFLIKMLPLVLLALAGFIFARKGLVDGAFTRQLSLVMINFFYPCLILSSMLRNFTWESLLQNWVMPVGTLAILASGWVIALVALPFLRHYHQDTRRCFHFVCLMNNYSFLPIILGAAFWGEEAIALVIFASLGAELCAWTLGINTLTAQRFGWRLVKNLFSVPMCAILLACGMLALLERFGTAMMPSTGSVFYTVGETLLESAGLAGAATIPASALITGARIAMLHPGRVVVPLMVGVSLLRLLVIPAVAIGVILLLPLPPMARQVLLLIAVQPAAMVTVSFAEAYHSDVNFAAAAVLVTHLVCLLTIPLWLALCL